MREERPRRRSEKNEAEARHNGVTRHLKECAIHGHHANGSRVRQTVTQAHDQASAPGLAPLPHSPAGDLRHQHTQAELALQAGIAQPKSTSSIYQRAKTFPSGASAVNTCLVASRNS